MSATANIEYFNGAALTAVNDIEGGGTKLLYNKSDNITTTTTPITAPQSAGTNYSYAKHLGIYVTSPASTTLTNLSIALGSAPTTGFGLFAVGVASASYVQAAGSDPADNGTTDVTAAGTVPTIYSLSTTRLSTSPFIYDSTGGSANVTNALVGKMCVTALGIGNSYVGGGGAIVTGGTNTVIFAFDEAEETRPRIHARRKRTGNPMPHPTDDAWNWRVHYSDGATFDEFTPKVAGKDHPLDDEWQDHGMAEVDAPRVVAVELAPSPSRPELPNHFMLVNVDAGERFIFFRTRVPTVNFDTGAEVARLTGTVIGWQKTIGRGGSKRNVQSLTCFLESGSSFTCSDRVTVRERLVLIAREMANE